jgi:large subunit ribosomal protein L28
MSRVCAITQSKPVKGHTIHRRGMAKKKGGVGRHVTANTPRMFIPNLKTRRIWVP